MAGKTRDKQRRDAAQIVLEVGSTLTSSLVLEHVLHTIARQVGEALDVTSVDIHDYDPGVTRSPTPATGTVSRSPMKTSPTTGPS